MVGDATQNQIDTELIAWIDSVSSKPAKNLTKDFSDGILVAKMLKLYYPRYVELHNYVPANSLNMKIENWNTLNRKVFTKIDVKLDKNTTYHLANGSLDAIAKLLLELKTKILKDDEKLHKQKLVKHIESIDIQLSSNLSLLREEKIGDNLLRNELNSPEESSDKLSSDETNNKICQSNPTPKVGRFRRAISVIVGWIAFLFFWNIFSYRKLFHFSKHPRNVLVDITTQQHKNDETMSCVVYEKMKRELREKEEIICTLNHKIAYLESSMKLKDLRISSLTAQILQNAVEMDCLAAKSQPGDGSRVKLRPRSHNLHETKAN